jgi:hypothetical protein
VHEVHAIDDAHGSRGQEVARHDPHRRIGHRRVRQALREGGFDLEAQLAGGFLRRVQCHRVGDADAVGEARDMPLGRQLFGDLGPKAMHQHEFDAHRVQDGKVLHEGVELAGRNGFAGQADDKGLAAIGVDVGRHGTKPGHEGVGEYEAHAGSGESRSLCRSRLGALAFGRA